MKILISGARGLVGSALLTYLKQKHETVRLMRTQTGWDYSHLNGSDAVVHLAGESIAEGRWTTKKKARIYDSRVQGTRMLVEAITAASQPPRILITASAMGYYGDRGNEILREDSAAGNDFLATVCRDWEAETTPAKEKGIRVVHTRFGLILSKTGGALPKMLLPFRLGIGGKIGSGNQWWSWITLDDVIRIIEFLLMNESMSDALNVSAPGAVTNVEFTKILGRLLHRPTIFPLPAFAARLALGEMADALLLSSIRMEPHKLTAAGYSYLYPELEEALQHVLLD